MIVITTSIRDHNFPKASDQQIDKMFTLGIVLKEYTVFIIVQGGHDSPHNNDHILLASSVKIPGSAGKNALGGIDGSSKDMGLLTS